MNPNITTPADGVTFLSLTDTRFTTARISVNLYVPLDEQTAGLYAMLPYLLRRGCRRFDTPSAFHRELDRLYGADIDGDVMTVGETQIIHLSMSCLDDRFVPADMSVEEASAKLLLDVLFDPPFENGVFRKTDVEQERRCTLESIAAEINDKRRYAASRCKKLLCAGEPYAVSKYGTKETVEALTAKELTDAWRLLLEAAPISVIYQGGGDGKTVEEAFAKRLGARRVRALPDVVMKAAKAEVVHDNEKMDVRQCQLVMGLRTDIAGDDPRCEALRLANAVFGGTPHSLLFLHVREEHSLCYYCLSRYDRRKGVMMIESGVEEESIEKAKDEILRQLEALKNGEFDDEALENARLSILDSLMAAEDSASATAGWYSMQLPGQYRSPSQVIESVREVTREQVLEAAATITLDCIFTLTPAEKEETV